MAALTAIITIVFGVLVLAFPKFLRWIIGVYLIVSGISMLF
jgi:uncharacterized membrane protein HdeD (DUF308 family)